MWTVSSLCVDFCRSNEIGVRFLLYKLARCRDKLIEQHFVEY